MQNMAGYPRGFFQFLLLVFIVLAVTGLLLLPNTLMMRFDWDVPVRLVGGGWRLATAALHCAFAFVIMVLVGALAGIHMRLGWRRRQNILSGFGQVLLFAVLVVTAVGIFYLGDEALSRWSSGIHVVVGFVLIVVAFWHGESGRRLHRRRVQSRT